MFLDKTGIVTDLLLNKLTEKEKRDIRQLEKKDLIAMHHGFGTWIRNTYGLWDVKNPHLNGKHPDDYSFDVIVDLWEKLQ